MGVSGRAGQVGRQIYASAPTPEKKSPTFFGREGLSHETILPGRSLFEYASCKLSNQTLCVPLSRLTATLRHGGSLCRIKGRTVRCVDHFEKSNRVASVCSMGLEIMPLHVPVKKQNGFTLRRCSVG